MWPMTNERYMLALNATAKKSSMRRLTGWLMAIRRSSMITSFSV